jgi:hypothetical protein
VEQDRLDFAEFYAAARDDCLRIVLVNVGDSDLAVHEVTAAASQDCGLDAHLLTALPLSARPWPAEPPA